jgi:hypothetical protein
MPASIGHNILPAKILESIVAIRSFNSPLKVLLWRQGKERRSPVPPSVAENPADTDQFKEDGDHHLSEVSRAPVVADGFLKTLHFFQIILAVLWVHMAIPVLRIAMIANGQFGKPHKVPVKATAPQCQADPIAPVGQGQAQQEKEQSPGLAGLITDIEILPIADSTIVHHISLPVKIAISQDQLFFAARARNQAPVFRWTGLTFPKAVAAMKENLHMIDSYQVIDD